MLPIQQNNDIFNSIKKYLQECNSKADWHHNIEGFLTIIYHISNYMKIGLANYKDFYPIGIILFNDRILISHSFFSTVIDWTANDLLKIISLPEFFCKPLTRSQFMTLVKANYIIGSILDWHVLRYPECQLTQKIIDNIIPSGGESFYLVSNSVQLMTNENKSKRHIKIFDIIDSPPNQNILPINQDASLESILSRYVENDLSGKCWLLSKNNNQAK